MPSSTQPSSIHLHDLVATFGARELFRGLSATLSPGSVTAVVGANGAGKSTLLRIVAGLHPADAGRVVRSPRDAVVGYLPQETPDGSETLLDHVRRRTLVADADAELVAAGDALARGDAGADDRFALALERWTSLGAGDLAERLAALVARVGLDADLDRPLGTLSGGQAARVSLLSVLASRFDVLLLDEPTNNLDADGIALITDFIAGLDAPVLMASHDRALIEAVATSVLEIDAAQHQVNQFSGGWADYRRAKGLQQTQARERFEQYSDQRSALVEQARRREAWASKGARAASSSGETDKHIRHRDRQRADAQAGRAATVRAALERLEVVEEPRKEWQLRFGINSAPPSADQVATLDAVVVRRGDFTLGPVSASIGAGDRIALLGPNGSGKTTLLEVLLGVREPDAGRRSLGARVEVGVVDQARGLIAGPEPLLDRLGDLLHPGADGVRWPEDRIRTLVAKFGLGADDVNRPCDSLSLGERTRASLALLQGNAVNLVVLDEPTNHLDVAAIEQLEQALINFTGTLVLVSHDAALLDAVRPTREWRVDHGRLVDQGPPEAG